MDRRPYSYCITSLSKGEEHNFANFKSGGEDQKKIWDVGNKRGERFSKIDGGIQLLNLNIRKKFGD